MKNAIYVIDPGMMEAGGHHAALIETLVDSNLNKVRLSLIAHKNLDSGLAKKAEMAGILVKRHFECNFYQHYDDSLQLKFSGLHFYIRELAWEYIQALKQIAELSGRNKAICFYPCLNWEHASALSLSLSKLEGEINNLVHKICCMFKPNQINNEIRLLYSHAFRQLKKLPAVHLYASDWETKEFYTSIGVVIEGYHPCYLLPWNTISLIPKPSSSEEPHFLLYLGDAKEDKGFKELPILVQRFIKEYHGRVKLSIQYTMAWGSPALIEVEKELRILSNQFSQLNVYPIFWNTSELVSMIKSVTAIICTYDTKVYQTKSSGLAWLSSYLKTPVVIKNECWLSREIKRLGYLSFISKSLVVNSKFTNIKFKETSYGSSIYRDFTAWLKS